MTDLRPYALLPMSPFNGYYSYQRINHLVRWAQVHFVHFQVFLMDGASSFNLMAIGYDESVAHKKTKKHDQNLNNKVTQCLIDIGIPEERAESHIVRLSQLSKTDRYIETYDRYLNVFNTEPEFKQDCLRAVRAMLLPT